MTQNTATVVRYNSDYVAICNGRWDISGTFVEACKALRRFMREEVPENGTVMVPAGIRWAVEAFRHEDAKEKPDWDALTESEYILGSAFEDSHLVDISDDEARTCREIAQIAVELVR